MTDNQPPSSYEPRSPHSKVSFAQSFDGDEMSRSRMASSAGSPRSGSQRRSTLRQSIRDSVATVATAVEETVEIGTVSGTALNTLCNVIGAGVLALPLAMHDSSIVVGCILLLIFGLFACLATFIIACGCDVTGCFSLNELFAAALVGPPSRSRSLEDGTDSDDDDAEGKDILEDKSKAKKKLLSSSPKADPNNASVDPAPKVDETANASSSVYGGTDNNSNTDDDLSPSQKKKKVLKAKVEFWRTAMSILVDLIIVLNNFGVLIVYGHVIGSSIPPVVEDFLHLKGLWVNKYFWLGIAGLFFFALTCARNFSELKWASIFGVATIMNVAIAVVIRYGQGYDDRAKVNPDITQENLDGVRVISFHWSMFSSIATMGVAFTYHYNAPSFYQELKDRSPKKMMFSILYSYPVIIATYIITGIFGYLTFGTLVADKKAGGDIVKNYDKEDVMINIARLGLFLHFVCVYPILAVAVRQSIHRTALVLSGQKEKARDPRTAAETPRYQIVIEAFIIVWSSIGLAAVVAGIDVVVQLTGALCGLFILLVCPGVIGLYVWREEGHDGRGGGNNRPDQEALLKGCRNDSNNEIGGGTPLDLVDPPPIAISSGAVSMSHRKGTMRVICYAMIVIGIVTLVGGVVSSFRGMTEQS